MADITILPSFYTTLNRFRAAKYPETQRIVLQIGTDPDTFTNSGSPKLSKDKQVENAVNNFNAANEHRLNVATNECADPSSNATLPQMCLAYNMPEYDSLNFVPTSEDTLTATYKKKSITIKCDNLEDGSKQHTIDFGDGSKAEYITFSGNRQMKINGVDFTMPAGAICETKTVNGKVFSQLIQLEGMRTNYVKMPEIAKNAEQILKSDNSSSVS